MFFVVEVSKKSDLCRKLSINYNKTATFSIHDIQKKKSKKQGFISQKQNMPYRLCVKSKKESSLFSEKKNLKDEVSNLV